jgi:hypothetical protein
MLKMSHSALIIISGVIWLVIGCMLLSMGLNFIVSSILKDNLILMKRPIIDFFSSFTGGPDQGALVLIALALLVGFAKGKFVFKKTVNRTVSRIRSLPNPAPLTQIYARGYYLLLGLMFFLGFIVRFLPLDIRGGVDVIIGSALLNGSMLYFRQAYSLVKTGT